MLNEVKHIYQYDSWETHLQSKAGKLVYGNGCTKTKISSIMHSKSFKYEIGIKMFVQRKLFYYNQIRYYYVYYTIFK